MTYLDKQQGHDNVLHGLIFDVHIDLFSHQVNIFYTLLDYFIILDMNLYKI